MKSSEEILKDPHAKIKKSGVTVLVVGTGLLTLVVFSVFGWLLRDFLIFDSSRTQAERELSRIRSEIAATDIALKDRKAEIEDSLAHEKERLQKLIKEIADHDAKMAQKQDEEKEYQALMAKIGKLKNDISDKEKEYASVAQEWVRNSALKTANATLESEKSNLEVAISKLSGEKSALQRDKSQLNTEVASLKHQQISAKGDMAKIQGEINNLKKEVDVLTNRINNLKKTAPNQ
jgi:chromosome segregation ATPase